MEQFWNSYTYGPNNSILGTDPDGNLWEVTGAAQAGVEMYSQQSGIPLAIENGFVIRAEGPFDARGSQELGSLITQVIGAPEIITTNFVNDGRNILYGEFSSGRFDLEDFSIALNYNQKFGRAVMGHELAEQWGKAIGQNRDQAHLRFGNSAEGQIFGSNPAPYFCIDVTQLRSDQLRSVIRMYENGQSFHTIVKGAKIRSIYGF